MTFWFRFRFLCFLSRFHSEFIHFTAWIGFEFVFICEHWIQLVWKCFKLFFRKKKLCHEPFACVTDRIIIIFLFTRPRLTLSTSLGHEAFQFGRTKWNSQTETITIRLNWLSQIDWLELYLFDICRWQHPNWW